MVDMASGGAEDSQERSRGQRARRGRDCNERGEQLREGEDEEEEGETMGEMMQVEVR